MKLEMDVAGGEGGDVRSVPQRVRLRAATKVKCSRRDDVGDGVMMWMRGVMMWVIM